MSLFLKPLFFIRSIILFVITFSFTMIFSMGGILGSFLFPSIRFAYWLQYTWGHTMLWLINVRVTSSGHEFVPRNGGVIYLFTHKSHFDVPAIMVSLPLGYNFGAKAELFRIPFFGAAMSRIGVLKIYRADRERVLQLYADSISRLKNGESFVLAPEGTRQIGKEIGPFKAGPFIFAISAQVPVVPVLVYGADEVLPVNSRIINNGRLGGHIHVRLLPPIPTAGVTLDNRTEFQKKVREIMIKAYSQSPVPTQNSPTLDQL